MDNTAVELKSPSTIHHASSTASLDQVSSLREAALSTLRAKRRKPVEKASLSRPPPPESIHLDYGQEEDPPLEPRQPSAKTVPSGPPATVMQNSAKQPEPASQDIQMREEGEISEEEEEEVPPAPQALKETRQSPLVDVKHLSIKPISVARPYSTVTQDISQSATQSRRSTEQSLVSPLSVRRQSDFQLSATHIALLSLDANHVRPGVQMTQQQYDTAKDIILDLLGWGVPPEYLVECGLSRELVFYVFAELNLRLPRNLDTTGLIPYTPEAVASARQAAALAMQSEVQRSPPVPPSPPKAKPGNDELNQLKPSEVLSPPAAEPSVSSRNLHDIEMQRREELLARKRAVLASRKSKQSPPVNLAIAPPAGSIQLTASDPTSAASADVDSFLKSISASTVVDASPSTSSAGRVASLPKSADAMDVDDIPGLGGLCTTEPNMLPTHQSTVPQLTPPLEESSLATHLRGSLQSSTDYSRPAIEKSHSASSVGSSTSLIREHSYQSMASDIQARRGAKRPVASDFVDLDTSTRLPTANGSTHSSSFARRKAGIVGFGSVNNGHRRCVIDLSDSEEEETEELLSEDSRREKPSSLNTPGSSSTPPVIPAVPPAGIKGPSQLELEIQRMKELIAKKEQDRLRKLASRTQGSLESSGVESAISKVKQEENDSLYSKSPILSSNNDVANFSEPYHDSSDSSIASVAAALAGAFGSIDDDTPAAKPQEANQLINAEQPAEDVVMQNVDEQTTGGRESTIEYDQTVEHVDVDVDMSSSAQVTLGLQKPSESSRQDTLEPGFSVYESPLASYPLLRIRSQISSMDTSQPRSNTISLPFSIHLLPATDPILLSFDFNSSHPLHMDTHFPDLELLKLATVTKRLDPLKRVCQYEIPGGGACRDGECEDVHLGRLMDTIGGNSDNQNPLEAIDPNDEDTSEYLFHGLPKEWLHQRNIKSPAGIKSALEEVRLQKTSLLKMTLEERVRRALAALEPPLSRAPPE